MGLKTPDSTSQLQLVLALEVVLEIETASLTEVWLWGDRHSALFQAWSCSLPMLATKVTKEGELK